MRHGSDTPAQPLDATRLRSPAQPFGCPLSLMGPRSTADAMLYALAPSRFRTPAQRFDVDSKDTDSARSTTGYNHAMSIAAPRWVGVAGLLGLLTGAIVLM